MAWVDVDTSTLTETVCSRYRSRDRNLYTKRVLQRILASLPEDERRAFLDTRWWWYHPDPPKLPVRPLTSRMRNRLEKELPF